MILRGNIPVNMGCIINQIVSVCAFLSNFHPVLVPSPPHLLDGDVEDYWDQLSDSDGECSESSESN